MLAICAACGDPASVMEAYNRGQQEFLNRNLSSAVKYFTQAVNLDSDFLNAYLMLAKVYYHNKDFDNALRNLEIILKKDDNHSGALYWKSRILIISGKDNKSESEKMLRNVLETDSHHIPARLLLALLYEKNGKYKEALHEYITALNEEDTLISARGNLAVLYRRLGLTERAEREIERATKIAEITGSDVKALKLIKSEFDKWEEK